MDGLCPGSITITGWFVDVGAAARPGAAPAADGSGAADVTAGDEGGVVSAVAVVAATLSETEAGRA